MDGGHYIMQDSCHIHFWPHLTYINQSKVLVISQGYLVVITV
jgi:hypothetical protein